MSLSRLPTLATFVLVIAAAACSGRSGESSDPDSTNPAGMGGKSSTPDASGATTNVGGVANSGGTANPGSAASGGNETSNGRAGGDNAATVGGSVTSGGVTSGGATNSVASNTSTPVGAGASTASPSGGTMSSSAAVNLGGVASSTRGGTNANGGMMPRGGAAQGGASNGPTLAGATAKGGATATGGRNAGGSSPIGTGGNAATAGATSCPAPPADAPAAAVTAFNTVNAARLGMGVPCDSLVSALNTSAQAHCDYYATNKGADDGCDSTDSAHSEISGCPGFTGADVGARIKAAGYSAKGYSECMAFLNNPANAVTMFIDSVYHRGPILSPWMRDMGYGAATGCDTIDFGTGTQTPNTVVAFYPYAGQTNVPVNFRGDREGPTPPAPASGWPSGYPVTVYVQGATITLHDLIEEATGTAIDHIWITTSTDPNKALSNSVVLYANSPLKAATTYRVNIQGTQTISGTTSNLDLSWTFTTK